MKEGDGSENGINRPKDGHNFDKRDSCFDIILLCKMCGGTVRVLLKNMEKGKYWLTVFASLWVVKKESRHITNAP